MKVPGLWIERDDVESTQAEVRRLLAEGTRSGVLFAHHQVGGRGRFGRPWVSERGDSLTMSLAWAEYAGHPKPWLLGMMTACACADVLDCKVRWPNDLGFNGKKLGGILTELMPDAKGLNVPVVGIGLNLNQATFPEGLDGIATSLYIERGNESDPDSIARLVLDRLRSMPEPMEWSDVEPFWSARDATPGKQYRLASGETGTAIQVGPGGELLCLVDGLERIVYAADALFGVAVAGH